MFTIKHEEINGHESIHETARVWREPNPPQSVEPNRPLFAEVLGEHPLQFCTGRVFVMNTAGKTVATYVFDWPPHECLCPQ